MKWDSQNWRITTLNILVHNKENFASARLQHGEHWTYAMAEAPQIFTPKSTTDGIKKQFSDYFYASLSTLEGVSVANEEPNKTISIEELTGVIKDLTSGKASFLDNISNDVIKWCWLSLSQPTMHLFNTTLKEGGIPNEWSDGLIIPIHKKGNRLSANNYRGTIMSSCLGKIFVKILTRQIDQHMGARELWKINKCGYKPDHRTEDICSYLNHNTKSIVRQKTRLYIPLS